MDRPRLAPRERRAQLLQAVFNAAVDRHGLPRDRRGVPDPNYEHLVAAPLRAQAAA